jgi:hypothetical protein
VTDGFFKTTLSSDPVCFTVSHPAPSPPRHLRVTSVMEKSPFPLSSLSTIHKPRTSPDSLDPRRHHFQSCSSAEFFTLAIAQVYEPALCSVALPCFPFEHLLRHAIRQSIADLGSAAVQLIVNAVLVPWRRCAALIGRAHQTSGSSQQVFNPFRIILVSPKMSSWLVFE